MGEREQQSGGAGCAIMGVAGLCIPPLYVLSVGPVGCPMKYSLRSMMIVAILAPPLLAGAW